MNQFRRPLVFHLFDGRQMEDHTIPEETGFFRVVKCPPECYHPQLGGKGKADHLHLRSTNNKGAIRFVCFYQSEHVFTPNEGLRLLLAGVVSVEQYRAVGLGGNNESR